MTDFLRINGVAYKVDATGGAEESPHDRMIGIEEDAFDGTSLSSVRGFKGRWAYPLLDMPEAEYAVLKAATATGLALPCTLPAGDVVDCRVRITSAPYVDDWQTNGYKYAPRVELREV